MLLLRHLVSLIILLPSLVTAQVNEVYDFWNDDTLLQKKMLKNSLARKDEFIAAAGKQYEKDYKAVYENHFRSIAWLWESERPVTQPEVNGYLQSVVQKIIAANPELKNIDARIVLTRDDWPNAVSMGDGSIAVNGGLLVYMNNEAELAFVISHELAHYYLDHSNKKIRKMVETYNSEAFKQELKRLSKEEYGVWGQLEAYMKKMEFGTRRHSRENEVEADRYAWRFMKHSGYDMYGIVSCLQMLDRIDDTTLYQPFEPLKVFDFESYPFKKKWIEKTSSIFAQMKDDDSPLTQQERDSLQTHPDCEKRIALLSDSVSLSGGGSKFLVSEAMFSKIKKSFFPEMAELHFRHNNLTRNLYYNLLMLQNNENVPLAVYSIARDLNILYERQKNHTLGVMDKENRFFEKDYNLLLRMIDRWRLNDIASVSYFFCQKYQEQMKTYPAFEKEREKAVRIYSESAN